MALVITPGLHIKTNEGLPDGVFNSSHLKKFQGGR